MVPKAYRWVGEMEEIARTFHEVGLPGASFEGFAETYRRVTEIDDPGADGYLERVASSSLLRRHVELFNQAVRTGDWQPMVDGFAEDADLVFDAPIGTFHGRAAIAEAYRAQPPDDEVELLEVHLDEQVVEADFAWRRAPGQRAGRMRVEIDGQHIARLAISFEPSPVGAR